MTDRGSTLCGDSLAKLAEETT